jgi:predicted transposase YbfD/YdcC
MTVFSHFSSVSDPRILRSKLHSLNTIFGLTITAVLCGMKSWEHISAFGKERQEELSEMIDFTNGVPSHDTLSRVFSMINPIDFHTCFMAWTATLISVDKRLIAIDGKVAKNSYNNTDKLDALYLVNAWACENKLALGHFKTNGKGHELSGVKALLKMINIKGAIISADALSCQKDISHLIITGEADYILAVKDNQSILKNDIESSFSTLKATSVHEDLDKKSGSVYVRKCWVITNLKMLGNTAESWCNLTSIIKIESSKTSNKSTSTEVRYYISSLKSSAKEFNDWIRSYWSIENSLHWVLDVNFNEDRSRKRKGYEAENFALINKTVINILNNETETKLSMVMKKLKAMCNISYLKKILNFDA